MKLFVKTPREDVSTPGLLWEAPPSENGSEEARWEATTAGHRVQRPRAGEPLIFFVEKGTNANNPFAMGVTIGRVDSNDVVIDDASVSRFHAWLQQDDRSLEWALTDAESKNGTWVDGAPAPARQRMVLADGAKIKVGDVTLTFMLAHTLKHYVEQRYQKA